MQYVLLMQGRQERYSQLDWICPVHLVEQVGQSNCIPDWSMTDALLRLVWEIHELHKGASRCHISDIVLETKAHWLERPWMNAQYAEYGCVAAISTRQLTSSTQGHTLFPIFVMLMFHSLIIMFQWLLKMQVHTSIVYIALRCAFCT